MNPYKPSSEPARTTQHEPATGRADLLEITRYQRGIQISVFLHLICVGLFGVSRAAQAGGLMIAVGFGLAVTWIAGVVFVFFLARKLYPMGMSIGLTALAATPIAGLLALLLVYTKANTLLRKSGIEVRFMGADLAPNGS